MICELCGRPTDKIFKVRIEGSVVSACRECSRYGEPVRVSTEKKYGESKPSKPVKPIRATPKVEFEVDSEVELVENFGEIIRNRRQKLGLKQEELGKLINEPASLIQRIEAGKFQPSPELAHRLEHKLSIKLLKRAEDKGLSIPSRSLHRELTLGDMVVVKKKRGS